MKNLPTRHKYIKGFDGIRAIAVMMVLIAHFPGETLAYKEILGIRNYKLFKNPFGGIQSYLILE